jgi:hypothetical protein
VVAELTQELKAHRSKTAALFEQDQSSPGGAANRMTPLPRTVVPNVPAISQQGTSRQGAPPLVSIDAPPRVVSVEHAPVAPTVLESARGVEAKRAEASKPPVATPRRPAPDASPRPAAARQPVGGGDDDVTDYTQFTRIEYLNRKGKWIGGYMLGPDKASANKSGWLVRNDFNLTVSVQMSAVRLLIDSEVLCPVGQQNGYLMHMAGYISSIELVANGTTAADGTIYRYRVEDDPAGDRLFELHELKFRDPKMYPKLV